MVVEMFKRYHIAMDLHPISAVTAEDPFSYYERLAAEKPFSYDERLGCWVAAGDASVEAALTHSALRVRPKGEPVPAAMQGTALGRLFSQMVRMNDGEMHDAMRIVVGRIIDSLGSVVIDPQSVGVDAVPDALMFAYPSRALAVMLGMSPLETVGIEQYARSLARAIGPGATGEDIRRADTAVPVLEAAFSKMFTDVRTRANAIAFLFQGYDSLAGTIGHALYPRSDKRELAVHNTRRFVVEDADIAGTRVEEGSTVLLVLASAPRFAFGAGPHACVAARIAPRIADAAVAFAREHIDLTKLVRKGFLPLQNARIPVLA